MIRTETDSKSANVKTWGPFFYSAHEMTSNVCGTRRIHGIGLEIGPWVFTVSIQKFKNKIP